MVLKEKVRSLRFIRCRKKIDRRKGINKMKYSDFTFARGYLAASERYNIRQNEKIMSSDA